MCMYIYPLHVISWWLLFFTSALLCWSSCSLLVYQKVCFSIGRYLISQGAHVGAVNSEGDTPLDIAEEEAMEELLQNEVNRQGNFEYEKLFLSIEH